MSVVFSTEPLPIDNRIAAWQWKAKELCGECRFEFPKRASFHGSIDIRLVGGLELMRFASSPLSFTESLSESAPSIVWVITELEGVRSYSQGGVKVILEPGDSILIDSRHPWSSHSAEESERLYVRLNRRLAENRLQTSQIPVARRISGRAGVGAMLFRVAASLYNEAHTFSPEEGAHALQAYFDTLSACIAHLNPTARAKRSDREVSARIYSFIEAHLPEPDLALEEVAGAVGISVRHLHRLFSADGHTVGQWIRDRRLEQCRSDLMDPLLAERTITEIAFSWGFSDSAHFSHVFRRKFGLSARTFRSNAAPVALATARIQNGERQPRGASLQVQRFKPN